MLQVENKYIYCFVRADLSFAQKAVQSGHALLELSRKFPLEAEVDHPYLIILEVPYEELLLIGDRIPVESVGFYESDLNNEITSVAFTRVSGEARKHFKKFKLLK